MRNRDDIRSVAGEIRLRPARLQDADAVVEILLRTRRELMPYAVIAHAPENVCKRPAAPS